MKTPWYTLGIPYVNRPDLLRLAVESVRPLWPGTFILDNSEDGEIEAAAADWPVEVRWFTGISLTFSQSMNYIFTEAYRRGSRVCLTMHNDAEAAPRTAEELLQKAREADDTGRPWGAIFTHYDTLVVFNMTAVGDTGGWDTVLPQYFADNDYYRRLRLAGWETLESGLPVEHHNGASSTIKADPWRNHLNGVTFPLYEKYYAMKWGGPAGSERFETPFGLPKQG